MSRRNVETIRTVFEVFNRTDFDDQGRTAKAWFFLSWEEAREMAESL